MDFYVYSVFVMDMCYLVVPNCIHTKARLGNLQPRNPRQKIVLPSVYLNATLLVVSKREPLVAPRARRHGVRVPARRRCGVQEELALDCAGWCDLEGGDVAGEVERVGARGCEEGGAGLVEEADVGAVHGVGVGDAWCC